MDNKILLSVVSRYVAGYPEEQLYVGQLVNMLNGAGDVSSRKHFSGHVTASALLLNDKDECLVIHHKGLNRILCPGGHIEPDDKNPWETALRELTEETGIARASVSVASGSKNVPIDIDHHGIPENKKKGEPAHEHWDMLYLFRLNGNVCNVSIDTNEIAAYSWQPTRQLSEKIGYRLKAMNR